MGNVSCVYCGELKEVQQDKKLVIVWNDDQPTAVEWSFIPQKDNMTLVVIMETGFSGTADEIVRHVADSTEGFTLLLAGAKAFLEYGIALNLTTDHNPVA